MCNGKKIKELFASTLNGISASVRCVSFIIVAINAKLPDKQTKKSGKSVVFC